MMARANRHGWDLTTALLAAVLLVSISLPTAGAENQLLPRYFESLRKRGLYQLGEEYAAARLVSPQLSSPDRLTLMIEFARTLVEHGALQTDQSRQELWDRAAQLLNPLSDPGFSLSDKARLSLWSALLEGTRANALAFRSELQPEQEQLRQQAIDQLRTSIDRLRQIDSRLETAPIAELGLTPTERQEFRGRVQLMGGEAFLWLGRLEPPGAQRNQFLQRGEVLLGKGDRYRSVLPEESRNAFLLQAAAARLQGDASKTEKLLERASSLFPEPEAQDLILAERLRLERSRGKLDQAARLAVDRLRQPVVPGDEFRAEAVETFLQAEKLAFEAGDKTTQQQALTEARTQHEQTGGIWRLKTTLLLQRDEQDRQLGPELAAVVRQALAAWQSGEVELAAEKYAIAAMLAGQSGLTERAFEYGLTRASIFVHQQHWKKAHSALQELVDRFPQVPRAAEAHLLLAHAIGQESPQSPEFENVLREHLQRFPDSATRSEAHWMLAIQAEQQGKPSDAILSYRQIPSDNPHKGDADLRVTLLLEQMFKSATTATEREAWSQLAAEEIRRLAVPLLSRGPVLPARQCETLLQCLQLCLLHQPPLLQDASQLLTVVQKRIAEERRVTTEQKLALDPAWENLDQSAVQLQIFLLASQKKMTEARELLQQRSRDDPTSLLAILSSLTDLTSRLDLENLQDLGLLQRMTVNELSTRKDQMTPEQRRLLDKSSIQASIALRDWSAAVRTLEDLHQQFPDDTVILRQLIDVSEKRGAPEDLKRAQDGWSRLEQTCAKGTPDWIQARVQIARLQLLNGDPAAARKLLGVTRTLYPQMGTPELKQQADQLWKELQNINSSN